MSSVFRHIEAKFLSWILHSGYILIHRPHAVLEATIMNALDACFEREPPVLGVLRRFEADGGVAHLGRIHADYLHLIKAPVVDDVTVLSRPDRLSRLRIYGRSSTTILWK
jgi:hypothetical protein